MLRLPRLQRAQAAGGQGARPRLHRDALADGERLPHARPVLEVLRPRPGAARRGRAGHRRPPRHLRPRVHREVLRGHGLLRARQLLRQLQRGADAVHDRAAQGLARDQLLLQHRVRRAQPVPRRRAVVASRRLRPAAGGDGPRVPLERLSRRHRPRQRVGADGGARARLSRQGALLGCDRPPRDTGRRAEAHEGHGLPPAHRRADRTLHRVQRLLAADRLRQPGRGRRVLGLPRAGGRHGPLSAAEVRRARAGRGGAAAGDDDPRHPPARGRPGGLHGDVQRDRRHARRRHRLPARAGQLPLRRRQRVRRRLAARAGCPARPAGVGEGVDGRPAQRLGAGPGQRGRSSPASSGRRRRRRRSRS